MKRHMWHRCLLIRYAFKEIRPVVRQRLPFYYRYNFKQICWLIYPTIQYTRYMNTCACTYPYCKCIYALNFHPVLFALIIKYLNCLVNHILHAFYRCAFFMYLNAHYESCFSDINSQSRKVRFFKASWIITF